MTKKEKQCLYQQKHYQSNKQYYKDKARLRHAKIQAWFKEYKEAQICVKCGESHPATLDFHHIDPKTKEFAISSAVKTRVLSISRLKQEIDKCEVLCSNCHRILHWNHTNAG